MAISESTPIQAPPLMRGWLHLGTSPVALIAGFVLVILTPTLSMRVAVAIFTLASATLCVPAPYRPFSSRKRPRYIPRPASPSG